MQRAYTRFIGVDLGGGRGKTTAVAEIRSTVRPAPVGGPGSAGGPASPGGAPAPVGAEVIEVATRSVRLWTDDTLVERLAAAHPEATVIAIDAPLTQAACGRCERPVCPGMEACPEPAVVWLRTEGRALVRGASSVAVASGPGGARGPRGPRVNPAVQIAQARLAPYAHRATDVVLTYGRGLLPVSTLGAVHGAIPARAGHLRRRLRGAGYELNRNLVEVSPAATIAALCGPRAARGYKRDADPWVTRASILERLRDLTFAPQSRMAREDVLQNDHCFDAVIAAYTAFLWARDGWAIPDGCFAEDGWIVAPP